MPLSQIERTGFAPGDLELSLEPADAAVKPGVPAFRIDRCGGHLSHEGHRVIATVVTNENTAGLLISSFLTLCHQRGDLSPFQPNAEATIGRAETEFLAWYEHEHGSKNLKKADVGYRVISLRKETDRFACSLGDSFDPRGKDRMPASGPFAWEGLWSVQFEIIRQQRRDQ